MTTREERIAMLEKASEERWQLIAERDAAQANNRSLTEELAGVRANLEGLQAVLKQRDQERGELRQLANVAVESLRQLTSRLN
jgi:hypothetical protein